MHPISRLLMRESVVSLWLSLSLWFSAYKFSSWPLGFFFNMEIVFLAEN